MNLLQMSMQAGLLILMIVILRAVLLRLLPKNMFLLLWGIVLCRLLIPFSVPSRFSIYHRMKEVFTQADANVGTLVALNQGRPLVGMTAGTSEQLSFSAQEQFFHWTPAFTFWLVGFFALSTFFAVVYFKHYRELRAALPVCDHQLLQKWLAQHKLVRKLTIWQSDRVKSPLTSGVIRPRIILPRSMNLSDSQLLQYVLMHEYCHIRRFDVLWKSLFAFALCLHWFNPLVWVMFILMPRDLELTCDEMVLRYFGEEARTAYAYALIGMAEQRNQFSPLYSSFSKNAAEERIIAMMKYQKSSLVAVLLAVCLVAGMTATFVTSAAGSPQTTNVAESSPLSAETEAWLNWYHSLSPEDQLSVNSWPHELEQSNALLQRPLPEYQNFGVSYDTEGKMLFHNQLVRYFWDGYEFEPGVAAARYEYFNEEGTVDVHTLREIIDNGDGSVDPFGKLEKIVAYSQNDFDQRDVQWLKRQENEPVVTAVESLDSLISEGQTFAERFAHYKDFGLTFVEVNGRGGMGNLFYQNRPIRTFIDEKKDGGVFTYQSVDGGEITLRTVYDKDGKLTGLNAD